MIKKLFILPALLLLASCTANTTADLQGGDQSSQSHNESALMDSSVDRLNASPRHQEWVEVENEGKTIHTFVVYPQTSDPRPVVLVIHENKGLNDWARSMADQIAEAGYIAIAPDLLSGYSEQYSRTTDFPSDDEATKAISALNADNVMSDLQAVADWAKTIPAANDRLASAGFCWGGARSFQFATASDDLDAALVFYGTGPEDAADYKEIDVPVFGFYGGSDARVNATIEGSAEAMAQAGNDYDYQMYDGAGHAFMRLGEDPAGEEANVAARNAAWERMKEILSGL